MSSEAEPTEREGEEGWGRRSHLCVCGGGVGVCDCQLWERDPPPGGAKVREKRKKEQEIEKREQVCGEMGGKEEKK